MKHILDLFASVILRRYQSMLDDAQKLKVVEFLFFIQNDIRLNQIASSTQVEEIWENIRDNEVITDFLLLVTQDLAFHLDESDWNLLNEKLARAYSIVFETSAVLENPIGDETLERMTDKKNLLDHLEVYPWLKSIMLMDLADIQQCLGISADDLKAVAEDKAS